MLRNWLDRSFILASISVQQLGEPALHGKASYSVRFENHSDSSVAINELGPLERQDTVSFASCEELPASIEVRWRMPLESDLQMTTVECPPDFREGDTIVVILGQDGAWTCKSESRRARR